ncbi:MAG: hypothetical protein WA864_11525 [Acetobacteraceae bacterium]
MLRGDLRCQFVGMSEPLAPIKRQGKGERAANIIEIGGCERRGFVRHAMTLGHVNEQGKNKRRRAACHFGSHSVMLAACQTTAFEPSNG